MGKICGIYKITSPTGKVYIGQSVNIKRRIREYKRSACKMQPKLYASLNKYGFQHHDFKVLEECNRCDLNILEQKYIKIYNSFDNEIGMNLRRGGGALVDFSMETRSKMRNSSVGIKKSNHSSKYIGVYFNARDKNFSARINITPKNRKYIGTFDDDISAAYAYDIASLKYHHGEHPLNFTEKERLIIKDNVSEKKVIASSKYKEVVKTTCKGNKFTAKITQKGKRKHLGTFASSYDAALYRDIYILKNNIDASKMNFKINYVKSKSINDINKITKAKKRLSKKIIFSSDYMGVTKRKTKTGLIRYDVSISVNYKSSYVGRFNTEIEAAQAYNEYVINNNLNRKLNEL